MVYYIAPQVWAWGSGRVRKMARLTDRVACILPFEERWLADRQVRAHFVGHPMFESLPPRPAEQSDLAGAWWSRRHRDREGQAFVPREQLA